MTTKPVYDMSQLDKVTGNITITKIRQATNQIATSLTYHHCEIEESQGYGHAWIILDNGTWLMKNNVTAAVPIPTETPAFTGTTSAKKFIYKAALKKLH
jgi:predicted glutamine amidotransferase